MDEEADFQLLISGKFVQCWVCQASRGTSPYGSYTVRKFPDGQLWLTPHEVGCVWSDEAGDGLVDDGLVRALYQQSAEEV